MIDLVKTAIAYNLKENFENIKIYDKPNEQGTITPCFFIKNLKTTINIFFNKKYKNELTFVIIYLNNNIDYNKVLYKLYDCLEYIKYDDIYLKTLFLDSYIDENALHLTIKYNFYTYKEESKNIFMENADVKQGVLLDE